MCLLITHTMWRLGMDIQCVTTPLRGPRSGALEGHHVQQARGEQWHSPLTACGSLVTSGAGNGKQGLGEWRRGRVRGWEPSRRRTRVHGHSCGGLMQRLNNGGTRVEGAGQHPAAMRVLHWDILFHTGERVFWGRHQMVGRHQATRGQVWG